MSGTIMSGRRGGVRLFSVISVTYPAGSVCTCTKGTKTYKAKNTSGRALFAVPEVGEWTVSCTDGTKTASKTVNITTDGQATSVTLAYELYLFSEIDGNVGDWVADNAVTITSTYMTIDDAGDSRAHTRDKVDLSMYNTLYIDAQREAGGAWTQAYIAPSDTTLLDSNTGVNFGTSTTRTTVKLDISSYNGSFYVCLLGHWTVCKIFNIWLGFETEVLKEAI